MWYILLFPLIISNVFGSPVIGGHDVGKLLVHKKQVILKNPAKYPYLMYLETSEVLFRNETITTENVKICGGVLVTRDVVLTAGHCISTTKIGSVWRIIAGIVHRRVAERYQITVVKDFVVHERYIDKEGRKYQQNDIGLLWLDTKLNLNREVKLAKLAEPRSIFYNKEAFVVGWGITEQDEFSEMLKDGKLKVISRKQCQSEFHDSEIIDTMICASSPKKKTVHCIGDSGGPLVVDNTVVGIASWVAWKEVIINGVKQGICDIGQPSVFTRVSAYRNWIDGQIKLGPPQKRKRKNKVNSFNPPKNKNKVKSKKNMQNQMPEKGFRRRCYKKKKDNKRCEIVKQIINWELE